MADNFNMYLNICTLFHSTVRCSDGMTRHAKKQQKRSKERALQRERFSSHCACEWV